MARERFGVLGNRLEWPENVWGSSESNLSGQRTFGVLENTLHWPENVFGSSGTDSSGQRRSLGSREQTSVAREHFGVLGRKQTSVARERLGILGNRLQRPENVLWSSETDFSGQRTFCGPRKQTSVARERFGVLGNRPQ